MFPAHQYRGDLHRAAWLCRCKALNAAQRVPPHFPYLLAIFCTCQNHHRFISITGSCRLVRLFKTQCSCHCICIPSLSRCTQVLALLHCQGGSVHKICAVLVAMFRLCVEAGRKMQGFPLHFLFHSNVFSVISYSVSMSISNN